MIRSVNNQAKYRMKVTYAKMGPEKRSGKVKGEAGMGDTQGKSKGKTTALNVPFPPTLVDHIQELSEGPKVDVSDVDIRRLLPSESVFDTNRPVFLFVFHHVAEHDGLLASVV
tara:strand:+ start:1625 stop:1963 length:339 start_codon:yes stop_codon:yes gene_type:complete